MVFDNVRALAFPLFLLKASIWVARFYKKQNGTQYISRNTTGVKIEVDKGIHWEVSATRLDEAHRNVVVIFQAQWHVALVALFEDIPFVCVCFPAKEAKRTPALLGVPLSDCLKIRA